MNGLPLQKMRGRVGLSADGMPAPPSFNLSPQVSLLTFPPVKANIYLLLTFM